jgi:hypothetical protein
MQRDAPFTLDKPAFVFLSIKVMRCYFAGSKQVFGHFSEWLLTVVSDEVAALKSLGRR